jgi:hypothetical protein
MDALNRLRFADDAPETPSRAPSSGLEMTGGAGRDLLKLRETLANAKSFHNALLNEHHRHRMAG